MNRQSVTSSDIASIGYDAYSQTLEIEFLSGKVYQYFGVPERTHKELMNASSHGQYLAKNIKWVYSYSEIK